MKFIFFLLAICSFHSANAIEVELSPSENLEEYELQRFALLKETKRPKWSFGFGGTPQAFSKTDFRTSAYRNQAEVERPRPFGIHLNGDYYFFDHIGIFTGGGEFSIYPSLSRPRYSSLIYALISITPTLSYYFQYSNDQWFIPFVRFGTEFLHYRYQFLDHKIRGTHMLPRFDLGVCFVLDGLEPEASGQMNFNYGILRTSLFFAYSQAWDSDKTISFEDSTYRIGFRFEL